MGKHLSKKGSTGGSTLLVAGSAIGIGMLALPIVTGLAGFFPSLVTFFVCFCFMAITALLLAEVSATFSHGTNIISLTHNTLGVVGKLIAWIAYLFLFYSLMVAYISKGGGLVNSTLKLTLIPSFGPAIVSLGSILIISLGKRSVDLVNRLLIVGFFVTFFWISFYGANSMEIDYLKHQDWSSLLLGFPFVITAFGFHNIVPSICDYLDRDRLRIRRAIIFGALICLFIYLVWGFVIQGNLAPTGFLSVKSAFEQNMISTEILYLVSNHTNVKILALYLSFFAIITSVLGQGLGLVDFLLDGLQLARSPLNRLIACLMVFGPAFILSHLYQGVFFLLLELAGGIAAIILFGILPVCMAYICRYRKKLSVPFLSGGKILLVSTGFFAGVFLVYEIVQIISRYI